jgi:hypothetical protein
VGGGAEENGGGKAGETCLNPDAAKAFAKALLEAAAEFLRENPWVLEVLGLRPGEEERRLASTVLEAARSHQPKKNELGRDFLDRACGKAGGKGGEIARFVEPPKLTHVF